MSIKTHYAIKQAGETDNAQPSTEGSIPPCAVLFYPCDEGTGGTIACAAGSGATITGAPTLSWAGDANTVSIDHDQAAVTNFPVIGTSPTLIVMVHNVTTTTANSTFTIGALTTSDVLLCKVSDATIWDSAIVQSTVATKNASAATVNVGDDILFGCLLDGSGNYQHVIVDSTGTAYTGSAQAITANAVDLQNNTSIIISAASAVDIYCFAMYQFSTAVPSDYETFLEELYANVIAGNKTNPVRWLTQT